MITVGPLPPEKLAYALARYSRSPDSIRASIEWVRTHDSAKFLDSFYFQYGHASIADLGHLALCFEGISELAAVEIEDEPLWDGQARSSRYQDFSKSGFVTPPEFDAAQAALYRGAGESLLAAYNQVHARVLEWLTRVLPKPEGMKTEAYQRNLAARAFDVARYLLFLGIPTGAGQVTSIRTLEKQIRRLRASAFGEVRALGEEAAQACAAPAQCSLEASAEPVAPTLAKYVDADPYPGAARQRLGEWAAANLPPYQATETPPLVDVLQPANTLADIASTLLYSVTDRPFRALYKLACNWSKAVCMEVIGAALESRSRRDELLREFRGGLYAFDMVMDIGAYRDLHRHRRCQQYRQEFTGKLGYDTPPAMFEAGAGDLYAAAIEQALSAWKQLPQPAAQYVLPFAARSRFLFKMDFAEIEYISRLRSGVKGHFSYRQVAWEMKQKFAAIEPQLAQLIDATPPWVEDPLVR